MAQVQIKHAVNNVVTVDSAITAGNPIFAMVQTSASVTALAGTAEGALTKVFERARGDSLLFSSIWRKDSCTGGTADTFTATNSFGASFCHISMLEWDSLNTASLLDQFTSQLDPATNGANFTSGNITTTVDDLIIGISSNDGAFTTTWGTGWTEKYDDNTAAASRAVSWAIREEAAGTYAASGTWSGSTSTAPIGISSFKKAASLTVAQELGALIEAQQGGGMIGMVYQ